MSRTLDRQAALEDVSLPLHATSKLHGACVACIAFWALALAVDLDILGGWHAMQPGQTKDPNWEALRLSSHRRLSTYRPWNQSRPMDWLAWGLGRKFGPRHVRTPVVLLLPLV
jgi:hypothetical protein